MPSGSNAAPTPAVMCFSAGPLPLRGMIRRRSVEGVVAAATRGEIGALVLDARQPEDFFRALEVLRALFDDPRRPGPALSPLRVLGLVATGDAQAAFAMGRYGIAGVVEERSEGELAARLRRISEAPRDHGVREAPLVTRARPTRLTFREEGGLPTVALGRRHAPETLVGLSRYVRALREDAGESTVFADVATLIEVMVDEGLTCQTNLATKAGAAHDGQFIGSFEFYRELRRTRYGRIPDHPSGAIEMDVFIAIDEVLHEVLHLLMLANRIRAGLEPRHHFIAEELTTSWWQGVVHHRAFPEWLTDRHILEINDDFMFDEQHQHTREFWKVGYVFEQYATFPWVPYVLARLPQRPSYMGERPDLLALTATFTDRPEAAFFLPEPRARLAIPVAFDSYPRIPGTLRIG